MDLYTILKPLHRQAGHISKVNHMISSSIARWFLRIVPAEFSPLLMVEIHVKETTELDLGVRTARLDWPIRKCSASVLPNWDMSLFKHADSVIKGLLVMGSSLSMAELTCYVCGQAYPGGQSVDTNCNGKPAAFHVLIAPYSCNCICLFVFLFRKSLRLRGNKRWGEALLSTVPLTHRRIFWKLKPQPQHRRFVQCHLDQVLLGSVGHCERLQFNLRSNR